MLLLYILVCYIPYVQQCMLFAKLKFAIFISTVTDNKNYVLTIFQRRKTEQNSLLPLFSKTYYYALGNLNTLHLLPTVCFYYLLTDKRFFFIHDKNNNDMFKTHSRLTVFKESHEICPNNRL